MQEITGYAGIVTTLKELSKEDILGLYRQRWQIELAFKRMKSLMKLRHLKKKNPIGIKAWLQGKLFVFCLLERLLAISRHFSSQNSDKELNDLASRWQSISLIFNLLIHSLCPAISLFECISNGTKYSDSLKVLEVECGNIRLHPCLYLNLVSAYGANPKLLCHPSDAQPLFFPCGVLLNKQILCCLSSANAEPSNVKSGG